VDRPAIVDARRGLSIKAVTIHGLRRHVGSAPKSRSAIFFDAMSFFA
jgi:hypothetical protein